MSASEIDFHAKIDPSSRSTIIGAIAVSIAFVMELTLVPLVLPEISAQFGLGIGATAWVFNSYGIAVALGVLLGGVLGEILGIRRVFSGGVLLFACGALVVSIASSFETLIAGRVMQGFGGGIFSPLVPLLLTRALPSRPGKILMIWGSVVGYVAAFSPLALGQKLAETGWEAAFILFALVSFVALLINSRVRTDTPDAVTEKAPKLSVLFQSRDLWLVFVYIFCTYGCITFFLFRMPMWLSEKGHGLTNIGLILSALWLSFSISGTLLRNRADGSHVWYMMLIAPLIISSGFPVAYVFDSIPAFVLSATLIGIGFTFSNAPSTQMVLKFAPKGMSAISTSLDITFARLGGVATVALLAHLSFSFAIVLIVVLALVAMICFLLVSRENPDGSGG